MDFQSTCLPQFASIVVSYSDKFLSSCLNAILAYHLPGNVHFQLGTEERFASEASAHKTKMILGLYQ